MSFEATPSQTLLMLRLVFGPREPKLKELKPELKPASLRKQLEAEGLIRLEKRGAMNHVVLTDKGWQWTQAHLSKPIKLRDAPERPRVITGLVLQDLLPRLQSFLERNGYALAELFEDEQHDPAREERKPPDQQARDALLTLGGGSTHQRLTLVQVRSALPEFSRAELDAVLLSLQRVGTVSLQHEDDPDMRNAAVEAAAIRVAGSQYHIVYLLN